jgi:hypothetical protein
VVITPLAPGDPLRDLPGMILSLPRGACAPAGLTDLPRLATQQVTEFPAGAAVPHLVNAAAPAAEGTPDAGAPAPATIPSGGKDG